MNGFNLSTISSIYVGSTLYSLIYIGSNKLWPLLTTLPYDAEIEYLESTGTLWIDTGYKHHSGLTKYEASVVLTNILNNYNSLFGARITHNGAEAYYIGVTGNGVAYSCIGGNKKDSLCSLSINTRYNIVSNPSIGWIINETTYSSAANNTSTRSLYNCYLYSLNQSDTNIENASMRIYHFVIYEGNTLIMDMIPVRVGQTGYMYDKVGGLLYGNNGTGNFILGRDKLPSEYTELDYISSTQTGGQYINLGIKLYETAGVDYDIAIKFNIKGNGLNTSQLATIFSSLDSNNSPWPGNFIRTSKTNVMGRYVGGTGKDNTLGSTNSVIELSEKTPPDKNVTSLNNPNNATHQYKASLFCSFSDTNDTPLRLAYADLYYFKLWVAGTLVRDMVPCKNSNDVVGLYDLVNNVFYTSPNGAAFIAGPLVYNSNGFISEYVLNGLIFHLDGIDKGQGSDWTDLVGGIQFTANGSGCHSTSNSWYFPGNNDNYLISADNAWGNFGGSSNYTVEVCYYNLSLNSGRSFVFRCGRSTNYPLYYCEGSDITWLLYGYKCVYSGITTNSKYTVSINSDQGFVNKTLINKSQNTDYWDTTDDYIRIGGAVSGGAANNPMNGDIYSIRIYNRKLTIKEQSQNMSVDNIRFNLGL